MAILTKLASAARKTDVSKGVSSAGSRSWNIMARPALCAVHDVICIPAILYSKSIHESADNVDGLTSNMASIITAARVSSDRASSLSFKEPRNFCRAR